MRARIRVALLVSVTLLTIASARLVEAAVVLHGAEEAEEERRDRRQTALLRAELLYGSRIDRADPDGPVGVRSIPVAGALSLALPGAGQAYNRQWIKAVLGVAIEVALLTGYVVWRNQGRDAEEDYKAYAHSYWSPARYAAWLEAYSDWLPATGGAEIEVPVDVDFTRPESWSQAQRERVRQLFADIRAVEDHMYHPETGAAFSHKLPFFGEQQYYELVGKYFQFAPGWDDYPAYADDDGAYIGQIIDPDFTGPGGTKPNVQGRFVTYARDHAQANDLLRRASRMTSLLLFNHVIAAVDAAVFAKLHNDRISPELSTYHAPDGAMLALATVRVRI